MFVSHSGEIGKERSSFIKSNLSEVNHCSMHQMRFKLFIFISEGNYFYRDGFSISHTTKKIRVFLVYFKVRKHLEISFFILDFLHYQNKLKIKRE